MSSKGQSDAEPEIDPNFDYKVSYGRRNPKEEIEEFRKEQKEKEKKSQSKESIAISSASPSTARGSSLEVGFGNEQEDDKYKIDIDANDQKIIRKKEKQSVDEFMSQFPQTDNKSKGLYNLIYNVMNDDEKKGERGLKNEFYKKEISEKKRQIQEQKVVSQMIQERLVKGKIDMDEKARTDKYPNSEGSSLNEEGEKGKEKVKQMSEKEMERFMYGHPTINGKLNVYGGRKVRRKKKEIEEEEDPEDLKIKGTHFLLSNIIQKHMEKNRKKMEYINLRKSYDFDEDKDRELEYKAELESKLKEKAIEYSRMVEIKRIEAKKNEKIIKTENKLNYSNKIYKYPDYKKDTYDKHKTENNLGEIMDKIDKLDEGIIKQVKEK